MRTPWSNSAAALTMTLALCGGAFAQEPAAAPATAPAPLAAEKPTATLEQPAKKKASAGTKAAKVREMETSTDSAPSLSPDTFAATKAAAERYQAIADAGGWQVIPGDVRLDATGEPVLALRARLAIEGDLPREASEGDLFDEALTQAVKSFQLRMGLKTTGEVTGATLAAINIPAAQRARQLAGSAQRIETVNFDFAPRHVVVNIPAAAVEAIAGGVVMRRYTAVVGDKDHASPQVVAKIQDVNLNPTWTIPTSIVKNEIV
ncbi:MAG: murein L,D-transpeptidase, partial [Hyphomicrobiales bacterium]|nr:murein L,D-transpeptidase [Hyphomicrobiales bacterium]